MVGKCWRRLNWPCSSEDSGESKLSDFMRKFSFWRRGECGAVDVHSCSQLLLSRLLLNGLCCCCCWMCVVKEVVVVVVVVVVLDRRTNNTRVSQGFVSFSVYAKAIKMYGKKFAI